jgi:hypothetical protein
MERLEAFLIIMVWLLEMWLALAFLALVEERMERSQAKTRDSDPSSVSRPSPQPHLTQPQTD